MKQKKWGKMMKQMFSMVLIGIMTLSMLTGCSAKKDDTSKETNTTATEEENTTTEDTKTDADQDKGDSEAQSNIPETDTLTVEVFDRGNGIDPINNARTNWIKEKFKEDTGIEITFVPVPRSEEVTKLNVLMAGNNAPDISFTYDAGLAYSYYSNNGLAKLDDALAAYGKDLTAMLGDQILSYGKFGDGQYAIPAKRMTQSETCMWIRQDWLDTLGMSVPTTIDEFYNTLVAFKEKNPGNVSNVVPMTSYFDIAWTCGPILESFLGDLTEEELYVNTIHNFTALPDYKEGVRFLNKLYNEGLLDPEFALYKDDSEVAAKTSRGEVGVYSHNTLRILGEVETSIFNQLKTNVPESKIVPFYSFLNSQGKYAKTMYEPIGMYLMIPASSKNVGGAIKYLNWLSTPDVLFTLQNGIEGEHFDFNEAGLPIAKTDLPADKVWNATNTQNDYGIVVNGIQLFDDAKNNEMLVVGYPGEQKELAKQAIALSLVDGFVYPRLPEVVPAEATYGTALKEMRDTLFAKSITAAPADFDAVYDQCLEDFMMAGGKELIEQRQAAWDATKK